MKKKLKITKTILGIINVLLITVPIITYLIIAFAGSTVEQKVVLSIVGVSGAIIGLLGIINKKHYGFLPLLFLIGMYAALNSVMDVIIVFAITGMLSDLIVEPLYKHYNNLYMIQKQIDLNK